MEDLVGDEPALLIHLEGVGGYFQQGTSVLALNPAVSTSMTTGQKPRKRPLRVNGVGHGISVGVKGGGIMAKSVPLSLICRHGTARGPF